jgi:F0F1-type ATP synthase membrane subunit b/b'
VGLEQQTRSLLELVAADRVHQVESILDEARRRAAALRVQANADARSRMRLAFAEQRRLRDERIAAARARLDTQRRLHAQQRTNALLEIAWQRLPGELLARWQDARARGHWVAQVVAEARARLPRGKWRVVHPADWPAGEQQALAVTLQAAAGAAPAFVADRQVRAGLKIVADGNAVDSTLDGLLAERTDFEARLLSTLESAS